MAYFGVPSAQLTVAQAALLAGIIPSPNNWDPAVSPEKAQQRWEYVLDGMVRDGFLTQADRDAQVFPPVNAYERDQTYEGTDGYLLQMVNAELTATGTITDDMVKYGGMKIDTSIDKSAQDAAVAQVGELLAGNLSDGARPADNMKIGLVSIDPATGGIVSLYGGPDFLTEEFNRVTQDKIQAGSTFKPFTLISALQEGIPLTTTYSGKSPQTLDGWDSTGKAVTNFGGESFGRINLIKATAQSVNTVYAQLNLEVGPETTAAVAAQAGVTTPVGTNPANVLGSDAVHPLDMASAYATIAAQGVYHKPFIVAQASYDDGSVAYTGETPGEQRFDSAVIADATYAMQQVVQDGSGKQWIKPLGRPIAGKTGTSTDNKSAWFVGFTPQVATAVAFSAVGENGSDPVTITPWGENARGTALTEITGATWPSALWAAYMKDVFALPQYAEVVDFPPRANVGAPTSAPTATSTVQPEATQPPVEPEQPTQVAVPSGLEGKLQGDAQAAVVNAGLVPTIVSASSSSVASGAVISVSPGGGTMVAPGSSVTITVSTGPAVVQTPAPTQTAGSGG
jgi:membrane peptidoglycan carboxypeptidase